MKFLWFKTMLSRVGRLLPLSMIHQLNGCLNYLCLGAWMKHNRVKVPFLAKNRRELYAHIASELNEPVTYLEFGVYKGWSMNVWSQLLSHPESVLHGFDSFEGLPETWGLACDKKTFDLTGQVPQIDDARVQFHPGWFDRTLPDFCRQFTAVNPLVIHLDADVYSSTIFTLRQLRSFITDSTILIFDEFFDREHEMKALTEFMEETSLNLACIGATSAYTQVAFRVSGIIKAG